MDSACIFLFFSYFGSEADVTEQFLFHVFIIHSCDATAKFYDSFHNSPSMSVFPLLCRQSHIKLSHLVFLSEYSCSFKYFCILPPSPPPALPPFLPRSLFYSFSPSLLCSLPLSLLLSLPLSLQTTTGMSSVPLLDPAPLNLFFNFYFSM